MILLPAIQEHGKQLKFKLTIKKNKMNKKSNVSSVKPLRLFNGRGHGNKYGRHHIYVAAKSMNQAAKLVSMACFDGKEHLVSVSEIKNYYSKDVWGLKMYGIHPSEPCVYVCYEYGDNEPFRVI